MKESRGKAGSIARHWMGVCERSYEQTGKQGSYFAAMATGENPAHESAGK